MCTTGSATGAALKCTPATSAVLLTSRKASLISAWVLKVATWADHEDDRAKAKRYQEITKASLEENLKAERQHQQEYRERLKRAKAENDHAFELQHEERKEQLQRATTLQIRHPSVQVVV